MNEDDELRFLRDERRRLEVFERAYAAVEVALMDVDVLLGLDRGHPCLDRIASLKSERDMLRHDVSILHRLVEGLRRDLTATRVDACIARNEGLCAHCGEPSSPYEFCDDDCQDCHEEGDGPVIGARFQGDVGEPFACERNTCGKSERTGST